MFTPGRPAGASAVANVWGFKHITVGETAAGTTVDDQIEPTTVSIPADAERVLAHITTTGHSFGNTYNCAEFCQMRHDIDINGETVSWSGWRDDCDQNPHSPQYGTWEYGRNGWCPGAVSVGGMLDVTDLVTPGEEASIDFFVGLSDGSEYENTSPVELRPYTYVALRLYSWDEAD